MTLRKTERARSVAAVTFHDATAVDDKNGQQGDLQGPNSVQRIDNMQVIRAPEDAVICNECLGARTL